MTESLNAVAEFELLTHQGRAQIERLEVELAEAAKEAEYIYHAHGQLSKHVGNLGDVWRSVRRARSREQEIRERLNAIRHLHSLVEARADSFCKRCKGTKLMKVCRDNEVYELRPCTICDGTGLALAQKTETGGHHA